MHKRFRNYCYLSRLMVMELLFILSAVRNKKRNYNFYYLENMLCAMDIALKSKGTVSTRTLNSDFGLPGCDTMLTDI
jgi:hypothetical protein